MLDLGQMKIEEKSLLNDNDDSLLTYLEQPGETTPKPGNKQTYIFGRGKKKVKKAEGLNQDY